MITPLEELPLLGALGFVQRIKTRSITVRRALIREAERLIAEMEASGRPG